MNRRKTIFTAALFELLLILCVGCANLCSKPVSYFFFYHVLYGMLLSFLIPLFLLRKEKNIIVFLGIKPLRKRQYILLAAFLAVSVGGQLLPKIMRGETLCWDLLPLGIVPLMMTTFFEEFLFRGFFQNKFEQEFGTIPAILVSGGMFSLYHLGYPGFRTPGSILLLFAVGLGFAAAFRLSGNHLIVAYCVNLPNALVTYLLKYEQFPVMTVSATIASAAAICSMILVWVLLLRAEKAKPSGSCSEK